MLTSATLITSILILLTALMCYAFAMQTIRQKKEQKLRLISAFRGKARTLNKLHNGFPCGFLTKELSMLILKNIRDTYEQLAQLEPDQSNHIVMLEHTAEQITEAQRCKPNERRKSLESPHQIHETQNHLKELNQFIADLTQKQILLEKQRQYFNSQIQQLMLSLSADNYIIQGQQAMQLGRSKMATHYFDLTVKLLAREGKPGFFDEQIAELKQLIQRVKNDTHKEASLPPPSSQTTQNLNPNS